MWFIIYLVLCLLVGKLAANRGHSAVGAFLLALFLSPLVGLIAAFVFTGDVKKCPRCAEMVKGEALVCKHCGAEFEQESAPPKRDWGESFNFSLPPAVTTAIPIIMVLAILAFVIYSFIRAPSVDTMVPAKSEYPPRKSSETLMPASSLAPKKTPAKKPAAPAPLQNSGVSDSIDCTTAKDGTITCVEKQRTDLKPGMNRCWTDFKGPHCIKINSEPRADGFVEVMECADIAFTQDCVVELRYGKNLGDF